MPPPVFAFWLRPSFFVQGLERGAHKRTLLPIIIASSRKIVNKNTRKIRNSLHAERKELYCFAQKNMVI